MSRQVDLHLHTLHSDGRLSPRDVVAEAAQAGLSAISITDHDVVSGLADAAAAAEGTGVEIVPGIELTARWQARKSVHILGYFIDPEAPMLTRALERARTLMAAHVDVVLRDVRRAGGELDLPDLDRYRHRYAGGAALVLGMLQRGVLRATGAGTGMRLLRLAAAEPRAYSFSDAIQVIHAAGGVASLAHPAKMVRGQPLLGPESLTPFVDAGLDALEAWQWIPHGWGSEHYRAVAAGLGLLVSGGSDDHGKRDPGRPSRLGAQRIPLAVCQSLRERALRYRPKTG